MNHNEALISVIVPVYNVAEYLPPCIESIAAQTHRNLEIILVDDGSTDPSGRICDDYSRRDSRIVVVHQPNGGLSAARNAGLRVARGEFIGFVDGDDYIHPQMYGVLLSALTATDCAFSMVLGRKVPNNNGYAIFTPPRLPK